MCVITACGVQCLVTGCRGSGAEQQAVSPGRGMLHFVIEHKQEMYQWMYLLQAINTDCQIRLVKVFGQILMFREIKKIV